MDLKKILGLLLIISLILPAQATIVTDSITSDGTYWNVPDGVTLVNLTVIGGGGSGGGGGYIYQVGSPTTYFLKYTGPGGLVGTKTIYSNVRVTPGASYQVHIGMPGSSHSGVLGACPSTGSSTQTFPSEAFAGPYAGGTTYIVIDGTTYSSSGGHVGNITVQCTAGSMPTVLSMNNFNPTGQIGYVVESIVGQPGSSSIYGLGGSAGTGNGAGGGGGGSGGDYTSPTGGAGSGGVGGQGIVQFTYDSAGILAWYPSGYVKNASGDIIQGASVEITQLLNTQTLTTDASGYYSSITGGFIANVPLNITTSKTGYTSDYNTFTPIDSGTLLNTTLLQIGRTCTPPCIEGVVREQWDHASIQEASVYVIENVSRTGYQTNTSTQSGYYEFLNLTGGLTYDIWTYKSGYSNSSVYQVVAAIT